MAGKERNVETYLLKDAIVVNPDSIFRSDVLLSHKILKIEKNLPLEANTIIDATGMYLLYGLLDPHVHLRSPSQEYKEDFVSGSAAAVHGGATTIFDMPNNIPFTDSSLLLEKKIHLRNSSDVYANIEFYLGLSKSNLETFSQIENCVGYKLYFSKTTGVDNPLSYKEVSSLRTFPKPCFVHAELVSEKNSSNLKEHNLSRPEEGELKVVKELCSISRDFHFTHVSSPLTAEFLSREGISFDLTPHHLFFSLEDPVEEQLLKVNPPIRPLASRDALRSYLMSNNCLISSDHAPHTSQEKSLPFSEAPSGISSLDIILPLWIELFSSLKVHQPLALLAKKNNMLYERFKLEKKGQIAIGKVSDIVLIDVDQEYRIDCSKWFSKAKSSPYKNLYLRSRVFATFVSGILVYHSDKLRSKLNIYKTS